MNELTPERLAEIKRYMGNVNLPFRVQTDLPVLVAEVETLWIQREVARATGWSEDIQSDLSAAQKRIEKDRKFIADLADDYCFCSNAMNKSTDVPETCWPCRAREHVTAVMVESALSTPPQ